MPVIITGTQGSGSQVFMQSYPSATVTVYDSGTSNLSSIFSDDVGTTKANPFTSDSSTGYWFFYADDGLYDIQFSNGDIPAPFSLSAVILFDPL